MFQAVEVALTACPAVQRPQGKVSEGRPELSTASQLRTLNSDLKYREMTVGMPVKN
jgi:hypothetical protein